MSHYTRKKCSETSPSSSEANSGSASCNSLSKQTNHKKRHSARTLYMKRIVTCSFKISCRESAISNMSTLDSSTAKKDAISTIYSW